MRSWTDFVDELKRLQEEHQSQVGLLLNPRFERLPLPITRYDDPLFPYSKAVVNATRDLVCAYVFDLASYMSLGAAGVVALERSVRYAGRDVLTILHGPFAGQGYSAMADATGFGLDAITVSRTEDLPHYIAQPPYAAFLAQYEAVSHDVPTTGGVYDVAEGQLILRDGDGEGLHIRLTDEELLTVGKLDDYAERIRAAVEEIVR